MHFGLIGFPLKNTFSKQYFENKFEALKIEAATYSNFPLESIDLFEDLLRQNQDLNGLNVTIPYKEKIIPYLTEIDAVAKEIGAVNCIKIKNKAQEKELIGYNTDAFGFEYSLVNWIPKNIQKNALVFGMGGAAKAVIYTLTKLGFSIQLVGRTADASTGKISYDELTEAHFKTATLLVNCSPVGMSPNDQALLPIPYQYITPAHFCYDLIYLPAQTLFLKSSAAQGACIKNGLEMLEKQADKAFEIWQNID